MSEKSRALFLKLFTQELMDKAKPKTIFTKPESAEPIKAVKPIEAEKPEEFLPSILGKKAEELEMPLPKPLIPLSQIPTSTPPSLPVPPPTPLPAPARPPAPAPKAPARPASRPPRLPRPSSLRPTQRPGPQIKQIKQIKARPVQPPPRVEGEIDLGKLNRFLSDKAVTMIECPGPNKFLFVKKAGQVTLTKARLSQEEIETIIENFSQESRIPVIGGVFKASVGNLTITAVVSEFVGSKFIIYRKGPYSILEKEEEQIRQAQLQAQVQRRKLF